MSKKIENNGIYVGGDIKDSKISNNTVVHYSSDEMKDVLDKILKYIEETCHLSEDDKFLLCKRVSDFKEEESEENKKRLENTLSEKMQGNSKLENYLNTSGSLASLMSLGLSFTGLG